MWASPPSISVRQELEKVEKDMAKAVEAVAEPAAAASSVAEPVKVEKIDSHWRKWNKHPPAIRAPSRFVWFPFKQSWFSGKWVPTTESALPNGHLSREGMPTCCFPSGGSTCLHLETESEQTHAADADGCLGIEDYIIIIYICHMYIHTYPSFPPSCFALFFKDGMSTCFIEEQRFRRLLYPPKQMTMYETAMEKTPLGRITWIW